MSTIARMGKWFAIGCLAGAILGLVGLLRASMAIELPGSSTFVDEYLAVVLGFGIVGALVGLVKPLATDLKGHMLVGALVSAVAVFAYGLLSAPELELWKLFLGSLMFGALAGPLYGWAFYK